MNIVIATDSFKGSASTFEVNRFIEKGVRRVKPNAQITKLPLADGGEGTVEALIHIQDGQYIENEVTDPLGRKVKAKFGLIDEDTAVIEMAEASGLPLITAEEKDPFQTTTYGTGELIKAALDYNVKEILIGLGGSATNDGGVGMAQALGASFKDSKNEEIGFGAGELGRIRSIDISRMDNRLNQTKVTVLSDVTNPLCGENGASYVYGPQKGASREDVKRLDQLLKHYGEKLQEHLQGDIMEKRGAGAAGGLGAGLIAFGGADIHSGVEKILDIIQLEEYVKHADLVITGEGRMDFQSVQGKAPVGVAKVAKRFGLAVIAIVASEGERISEVYDHGIDLVIDIINQPMRLEEAMKRVSKLTENAGEKAMRAFCLPH
ncbi:glycerate kinase [Salinibacillus kushneri]|uniref:Glycerate kinase n=1 Tax=Salinibacillus kushneri TaxID=237682 RepID=A0A1I0IGN9_9BACI|nr:glycerate kinase [Salinibacillus kushneri]SET96000.1 glycerate kinase [Salinibacillus kushneri]